MSQHLEQAFLQAKNIRQLKLVLQSYLKTHGITSFAFTYYATDPNTLNKIKYEDCSDSYKSWHKHYLDEKYEEIDSTFDSFKTTTLPIAWNVAEQIANAKSPREKQMRLDTLKFGTEKGISIPLYGPYNGYASLLLIQKTGEKCLDKWPKIKYEIFAMAHCYFNCMQNFLIPSENLGQPSLLTEKEKSCLRMVAQFHSMEFIAQSLDISVRTVNFHIQNFNKKLGVKNKYQAIVKAAQLGLL